MKSKENSRKFQKFTKSSQIEKFWKVEKEIPEKEIVKNWEKLKSKAKKRKKKSEKNFSSAVNKENSVEKEAEKNTN